MKLMQILLCAVFFHGFIIGSTNDSKNIANPKEVQEKLFVHNTDSLDTSTLLSQSLLTQLSGTEKYEYLFTKWDEISFEGTTDTTTLGYWNLISSNSSIVKYYIDQWNSGQNTKINPKTNESINRCIYNGIRNPLETKNSNLNDIFEFLNHASTEQIHLWTTKNIHEGKRPLPEDQRNFGNLLNKKRTELLTQIRTNVVRTINQLRGNTLDEKSSKKLLEQLSLLVTDDIKTSMNSLYKIAIKIKSISNKTFDSVPEESNVSGEQILALALSKYVKAILGITKSLEKENKIREKTNKKMVNLIRELENDIICSDTTNNPN